MITAHEIFVSDRRERRAWKERTLPGFRFFGEVDYFDLVFRTISAGFTKRRLTFYLTSDLNDLPTYGEDVVPVVLADEWCRIPRYAHRVGLIFKAYGTRPYVSLSTFRRPGYRTAVTLVQFVRNVVAWAPGAAADLARTVRNPGSRCKILDIPLGCYRFESFDAKSMADRSIGASFTGSVKQGAYGAYSPKNYLQTPKTASRVQLAQVLATIAARRPDLAISYRTTAGFPPPGAAADTYLNDLANTKVCLAPRGTSPETLRVFEGLRAGCVIVTEPLPRRWFYDGAPFVVVDDWRDLVTILPDLLDDRLRLERLHEASLQWWNEKCSPEAVGAYMIEALAARY